MTLSVLPVRDVGSDIEIIVSVRNSKFASSTPRTVFFVVFLVFFFKGGFTIHIDVDVVVFVDEMVATLV